MPDDDPWKEQLAFVSGYILVFGFALLKLWPLTATFQTGMNISLFTMNLPQEGVKTELGVFWSLTALLAVALSAVFLAVVHILCRGLWLAFSIKPATSPLVTRIGRFLDRWRQLTYDAAFILLFYLVFVLALEALMMGSAGLERALVSYFSLSMRAAGWTSRIFVVLVFLALYFLGVRYARKYMSEIGRDDADAAPADEDSHAPAPWKIWTLGSCVFIVMWFLAIEMCHRAEIDVAGKIFDRGRSDLIEVDLALGGATSAVNLAQLKLSDARGVTVQPLAPQGMGEGKYISILQSQTLSTGRYQVVLDYPHLVVDSSFPFFHRRINASRWFVVVSGGTPGPPSPAR
jgi:hypothetical protein